MHASRLRPAARIALAAVCTVACAAIWAGVAIAQEPAAGYQAPRTPDGQPDLQGYWTNLTYTPFERPAELGDQATYTEEEAVAAFNKAVQDTFTTDQLVHYVQSDFAATPVQSGARPNLRTSLVIAPANGQLPALTAEAERRIAAERAAARARGPLASSWRDDRGAVWCVFHDRVVPSIPAPYGSNYHIVQSRDWIVFVYEWNSERRIIPLDGRPHGAVRNYAGDSTAHWEGDTLVVETTNFSSKRDFFGSPGTPPAMAMPEDFRLTERFTRSGPDTIIQTYTVDAPSTWTQPWTVELPMHRIAGPMLEYACNENNSDAFTALRNARAEEAGTIAPADAMRRGDAKAVIGEQEQKGAATVIGAGETER